MSRCFPFPPPGYEKKARQEEGDLLKEEKRKEKKHKKEKKDKDKKEGKEKRDKDRSDGKQKEKSEKKEKHRDKKEKHKDKRKDKDKEKISISEEARAASLPGTSSGEKLHERNDHNGGNIRISEAAKPTYFPGTSSGEKLHERNEHNGRNISSETGRPPNKFHVQHGEKPFKTILPTVEVEGSKFVQELDRRIRDEEKGGAQSQLAERFPVEWKRDEKTDRRVVIKGSGNLAEDKEKKKAKGVDNVKKMDGRPFRGEPGPNAVPPILSRMANSKLEGVPRPVEESPDNVKKMDGRPFRGELGANATPPNLKMDGRPFRGEFGANAMPPNLSTMAKSKFEGVPRPMEGSADNVKKMDGRPFRGELGATAMPPNLKMDGRPFRGELGASAMPSSLSTAAKSKSEGVPRPMEESFDNVKRMDGQSFRGEIGANATPPNLPTTAKSKFEGFPRPMEESVDKTRGEKQKTKGRHDDKPREKNKDKEREKDSRRKQKDKEKEKKKEEKKAKDRSEHKKSQEDKSRDTNRNNFVGPSNNNLPVVSNSKEITAGLISEGIVKKRKEIETNGFLHESEESEVRPAKLPRPSSSQQLTQNGKKWDPHMKVDPFSSSKQGVSTDIKVEKKEHKVNGIIEVQPSSTTANASLMIPGSEQIAEASKRPPHPDSKYLSQIFSVPKMDDWCGFDDQEWLLGSDRALAKKAETCLNEVNKEHWVWSEALQIDSADVCALPYVIPY